MSADRSSMKILRNPLADKAEKVCQTERGFSLIEILGVLAIMGILAGMLAPSVIRQLQQARTTNEDANLEEVARAIVEGIKATGTIPNPNLVPYGTGGWADVAYRFTTLTDDTAPGGGFAPGTLHYVFPAEANFSDVFGTSRTYADTARRVYLDPVFLAYLESLFGDISVIFNTPADGWPETTTGGINFPNQAIKLFVVSSSRPDFVLSCPINGLGIQVSADSYRATLVNELVSWIKVIDPATGFIRVPGAAIENWPNNGHQFLHVKVVDLRPLFCRVELTDFASPLTADVTVAGGAAKPYVSAAVVGNQLGYDFRFNTSTQPGPPTYLGLAIGNVGNVCGSTKQLITRPYVIPAAGNLDDPATPTEDPTAQFQLNLPDPPWWDIAPPILLGGQQMPANANNQAFYVIKGTTLTLYAGAAALPAAPILTVQINADSSFQYCNGAWTRVD